MQDFYNAIKDLAAGEVYALDPSLALVMAFTSKKHQNIGALLLIFNQLMHKKGQ